MQKTNSFVYLISTLLMTLHGPKPGTSSSPFVIFLSWTPCVVFVFQRRARIQQLCQRARNQLTGSLLVAFFTSFQALIKTYSPQCVITQIRTPELTAEFSICACLRKAPIRIACCRQLQKVPMYPQVRYYFIWHAHGTNLEVIVNVFYNKDSLTNQYHPGKHMIKRTHKFNNQRNYTYNTKI